MGFRFKFLVGDQERNESFMAHIEGQLNTTYKTILQLLFIKHSFKDSFTLSEGARPSNSNHIYTLIENKNLPFSRYNS